MRNHVVKVMKKDVFEKILRVIAIIIQGEKII